MRLIMLCVLMVFSRVVWATPFQAGAGYDVCFVPDGQSCERLLVRAIAGTQESLLVQAYSFTSPVIAKAVVEAHRRGVSVRVLVDKSQVGDRYTSATFLRNAGIPVLVDSEPAIAHNKVMVFDGAAVFTGSYNFTRSAEERNAENGVLIHGDRALVSDYIRNWLARASRARPL